MVNSISINTSVCNQIGAACVGVCEQGLDFVGDTIAYVDPVTFAFELALITTGGVLVVRGIKHLVVAIKLIRKDNRNDPHLQDYISLHSEGTFMEAMEQPNHYKNRRYNILENLFGSVDQLARSSLPLLAGYVLDRIRKVEIPSAEDCSRYQANFTYGCSLAMQFFIQAIENVVGGEEVSQ